MCNTLKDKIQTRSSLTLFPLGKAFLQFLQVIAVCHHQDAIILFEHIIVADDDRFLTPGDDNDTGLIGEIQFADPAGILLAG